MPWFPDFVAAAELARRETRAAGQADPVAQYLAALDERRRARRWRRCGPVTSWCTTRAPARSAVTGSCASSSRRATRCWRSATPARETVGVHVCRADAPWSSCSRTCADDGETVLWPVAVVAESLDDVSVEFRTYCSQWPVDGRRPRPGSDPRARAAADPGDVVGRYQAALDAGDVDAIVQHLRRRRVPPRTHRTGRAAPRRRRAARVLRRCFGAGRWHRPRALRA